MEETITIAGSELERVVAEILMKHGMPEANARIVGESTVQANLRGVDTHGIMRLPIYVKRLKIGVMRADAQPEVVEETVSTAVVDAQNGMGQVAGHFAIEVAARKAAESPIVAVGVRNSAHFGTAAYYGLKAAEKGLIAFAMSNTTPLMPPTGGKEARVGNNPVSICVPRRDARPVVLDMALSMVAVGKFMLAKKEGRSIPEGWAINKEGRPTTDPDEAVAGFPLPMGGPKGYGLALMVDILAGILSGSGYGSKVKPMYKDFENHQRMGQFYIVINPAGFLSQDLFYGALEELLAEIKNTKTIDGVDEIKLPGEIEWGHYERRTKEGIPVAPAIFDDLMALVNEAGVTPARTMGGE